MDTLSTNDVFRGLILYGLTASTYKMAVGHLLSVYSINGVDRIPLEDMASDILDLYSQRFDERGFKPQLNISGRKTVITNQINKLNYDRISRDDAISKIKTDALFKMVLPKFHNLGITPVPIKFYEFDQHTLILTKRVFKVFDDEYYLQNQSEVNSRWDLIESAFESIHQKIILSDHYADLEKELIIKGSERTRITGIKSSLIGYQQNRCFYCGEHLSEPIHVDHVIPRTTVQSDEIWNLVLSHADCNLSKSDNVVAKSYIQNLIDRNEGLISSNHPLKDTLIREIGSKPRLREKRIWDIYGLARAQINRFWKHEKYRADEDLFYRRFIRILRTGNFIVGD